MWRSFLKSMQKINIVRHQWPGLILLARHTTIDYMVKTFRDQESERAFRRLGPLRIGAGVQCTAQRKLAILDAADCREDLHCSPRSRLARITRSGEILLEDFIKPLGIS